ncbi:hypothetical protein HON22_05670 [Candidatus Peregrinibacteria bacterium]|jgi:hypothetical protein|nr:hypothetical protein [Candidatus Peregrinibacteria bacterium]
MSQKKSKFIRKLERAIGRKLPKNPYSEHTSFNDKLYYLAAMKEYAGENEQLLNRETERMFAETDKNLYGY